MAAFDQTPKSLKFGNLDVLVREMPLPRVKRFQGVFASYLEDINSARVESADKIADGSISMYDLYTTFINLTLDRAYDVLEVIIPDLPKEPFEDEEDGVTIPQLLDAFDNVLEMNRLGWMKKAVPFFQTMAQGLSLQDAVGLMTSATQKIVSTRGSLPAQD